jgi:nitrate reductase assembly molybdenum cofactor insertion protein NarJ
VSTENQKQIWIGLVGVRSLPDAEVLKEIGGAYVNVLTWASDRAEFQKKAQELMDYLHLMLVTIENPEPLSNRGRIEDLDDNIAEIATRVQQNPNAIIYGTFHTWTEKST